MIIIYLLMDVPKVPESAPETTSEETLSLEYSIQA